MSHIQDQWKIDYQAASNALHDDDYAAHARRLVTLLSDEFTEVYRRNTEHPVMIEEAVMEASYFLFDMREVLTPTEMIETHGYLLKESRIVGAYGFSTSARTKRPSSKGFVMSNMFGGTEETFGKSYDKGHFICHGAGGGGDWNLFPQLRALNRGWSDEGKLYRNMEAYVAAHLGTMFFSRPIYSNGSLCPSHLEYGVLMPDRHMWCATFSNQPSESEPGYGRPSRVAMPPELQGVPNHGRSPSVAVFRSGRGYVAGGRIKAVASNSKSRK
ncbi:MAG TPA: hypothetical protein DIT13_05745 [Verrucomicrobiales bacterium]|nr:hypothetical protein [Verrucomicrobiales bacterium]